MCFYNDGDYDWIASVNEHSDEIVAENVKCSCNECGRVILAGQPVHRVFQQEHEECQCEHCEYEGENPYSEEDPEDRDSFPMQCQQEFGETFHYNRCEACTKLLNAIESVEIDEGCPPGNRQPELCELRYALTEHENAFDYAERAVSRFPELWNHRFIEYLLED